MYPPIFEICALDPAVQAVLGFNPVRLFPFGLAPQGVTDPYAVWQVISGGPMNNLSGRPTMDTFSVQVDVYGTGAKEVRAAAAALRDALELKANITAWRGESRDIETGRYRLGFDVDFIVFR